MPEEGIGLDAPVARDIAVGTLDWGDVPDVGELACKIDDWSTTN
jgi:hypothetical protein